MISCRCLPKVIGFVRGLEAWQDVTRLVSSQILKWFLLEVKKWRDTPCSYFCIEELICFCVFTFLGFFYNRAACQYCYKKDKVTNHDVVYPAIISCDTLLIWITSLRQKLILCKSNFEQIFQPWCQKNVLDIFIVYDWMITYSKNLKCLVMS